MSARLWGFCETAQLMVVLIIYFPDAAGMQCLAIVTCNNRAQLELFIFSVTIVIAINHNS